MDLSVRPFDLKGGRVSRNGVQKEGWLYWGSRPPYSKVKKMYYIVAPGVLAAYLPMGVDGVVQQMTSPMALNNCTVQLTRTTHDLFRSGKIMSIPSNPSGRQPPTSKLFGFVVRTDKFATRLYAHTWEELQTWAGEIINNSQYSSVATRGPAPITLWAHWVRTSRLQSQPPQEAHFMVLVGGQAPAKLMLYADADSFSPVKEYALSSLRGATSQEVADGQSPQVSLTFIRGLARKEKKISVALESHNQMATLLALLAAAPAGAAKSGLASAKELLPPSPQTTRKNAGLSREDMMDVSLVPASAPSPTPAPRSPEPKAHQEPSSPSNYLARHARLPSPNKDLASTTIAAPASPVAIAGDAAVSPTTPSARPDDEARPCTAATVESEPGQAQQQEQLKQPEQSTHPQQPQPTPEQPQQQREKQQPAQEPMQPVKQQCPKQSEQPVQPQQPPPTPEQPKQRQRHQLPPQQQQPIMHEVPKQPEQPEQPAQPLQPRLTPERPTPSSANSACSSPVPRLDFSGLPLSPASAARGQAAIDKRSGATPPSGKQLGRQAPMNSPTTLGNNEPRIIPTSPINDANQTASSAVSPCGDANLTASSAVSPDAATSEAVGRSKRNQRPKSLTVGARISTDSACTLSTAARPSSCVKLQSLRSTPSQNDTLCSSIESMVDNTSLDVPQSKKLSSARALFPDESPAPTAEEDVLVTTTSLEGSGYTKTAQMVSPAAPVVRGSGGAVKMQAGTSSCSPAKGEMKVIRSGRSTPTHKKVPTPTKAFPSERPVAAQQAHVETVRAKGGVVVARTATTEGARSGALYPSSRMLKSRKDSGGAHQPAHAKALLAEALIPLNPMTHDTPHIESPSRRCSFSTPGGAPNHLVVPPVNLGAIWHLARQRVQLEVASTWQQISSQMSGIFQRVSQARSAAKDIATVGLVIQGLVILEGARRQRSISKVKKTWKILDKEDEARKLLERKRIKTGALVSARKIATAYGKESFTATTTNKNAIL